MVRLSVSGNGALSRRRLFERLAFEIFHHQVVDSVFMPDVVQHTDVRVVARQSPALHAETVCRVAERGRRVNRQNSIATSRPSLLSRARYTSPIAARSEKRVQFVGAEPPPTSPHGTIRHGAAL